MPLPPIPASVNVPQTAREQTVAELAARLVELQSFVQADPNIAADTKQQIDTRLRAIGLPSEIQKQTGIFVAEGIPALTRESVATSTGEVARIRGSLAALRRALGLPDPTQIAPNRRLLPGNPQTITAPKQTQRLAMRIWTDRSGNRHAKASLLSVHQDVAHFRLEDGRTAVAHIDQLSNADRQFISGLDRVATLPPD